MGRDETTAGGRAFPTQRPTIWSIAFGRADVALATYNVAPRKSMRVGYRPIPAEWAIFGLAILSWGAQSFPPAKVAAPRNSNF